MVDLRHLLWSIETRQHGKELSISVSEAQLRTGSSDDESCKKHVLTVIKLL